MGHYQAGGYFDDSLMSDAPTVMSAFGNPAFNTVTVMLESPAAFDQLRSALKANPSIDVDVRHEIDLMREQSKGLSGVLDFVSYFVGVTMAIGATLGAINAMYAIVDSRKRELATLRAIGFGVGPVILAVLAEALILVLPGAILGALAAWLFVQRPCRQSWRRELRTDGHARPRNAGDRLGTGDGADRRIAPGTARR